MSKGLVAGYALGFVWVGVPLIIASALIVLLMMPLLFVVSFYTLLLINNLFFKRPGVEFQRRAQIFRNFGRNTIIAGIVLSIYLFFHWDLIGGGGRFHHDYWVMLAIIGGWTIATGLAARMLASDIQTEKGTV